MKKTFVLAIICIAVISFLVWKKSKTSMTVIFPEKSVFFIDQELSQDFKKNIENSIQTAYAESKNPQDVMNQATISFPEIESMKVQICQSDKICFYVEAAEPIFLLNQEFVVCKNSVKVEKNHFLLSIVENLVPMSCRHCDNMQAMIDFVSALPEKLKQEYLIDWLSQDDIVLQPKDNKNCILQASTEMIPSMQDFELCQKIAQAADKKLKTKKKRMVYDVRFKNQIIVR